MIRRFFAATVLLCGALPVAGCAVGGAETTSTSPGGSRLVPTFKPERQRHQRPPLKTARPSTATTTSAAPAATQAAGDGSPSAHPATAAGPPTAGSPSAATDRSARVADGRGDASGLNTPAYVDLTGAVITRSGDRFTVRVDVGATLPTRQTDDHTMNVACFVDTDGDGSVDYEMWANLSDAGWGTSYRHPEGARFGDDSGVGVAVAGHTLTLAFPASHVGGATSFRWAVGSEYGTLAQVSSGTTAHDLAPDGSAVRYP